MGRFDPRFRTHEEVEGRTFHMRSENMAEIWKALCPARPIRNRQCSLALGPPIERSAHSSNRTFPMNRSFFFGLCLTQYFFAANAQWVGGGSFSTSVHHQACAFHQVDTGLFVYGANDPGQGEGGVVITWSGLVGSGAYIWYTSPGNVEDIDVRMASNGRPIYLAAGHQQYNQSMAVYPYLAGGSAFDFESVITGSGRYYRAIRMRSDIVAFAAGGTSQGNGIIDMSTDTGYTWTNIAELPGQPVSRLHFVNDQVGFAATGGYRRLFNNGLQLADSGAIYRTENGGLEWSPVLVSDLAGFSDVAFLDDDIGVATRCDGALIRTTDGGDTWMPASVSIAGDHVLTSVTFRPDGTGFAGCYRPDGTEGMILISEDQGVSWHENFNSSGLNHSRRVYDVYFFDDAHGYASTHIRPLRTEGVVTGVSHPAEVDFDLWPNPTADDPTIRLDETGAARIDVIDSQGRLLRTVTTMDMDRVELPVSDLAAGSYLVRVRQHGLIGMRSFIRW
jgi:Secretion system C-terminal sorting domain